MGCPRIYSERRFSLLRWLAPLLAALAIGTAGSAAQTVADVHGITHCDKTEIVCRRGLVDRLVAFAATRAGGDENMRASCLREGLDQLQSNLNEFTSLDLSQIRCLPQPQDASLQYRNGLQELLEEAKSQISVSSEARITFGVPTTECDFPHTVVITRNLGELCTGTLVDSKTVLTAAHCVCDLRIEANPTAIRVKATHDARDGKPGVGLREIKPSATFSGWNCQNRFSPPDWGRDLALLFLEQDMPPPSVNACARPSPAKIASTGMYLNPVVSVVTIVGFGRDERAQLGRKKWANLPIVSKICGDDISHAKFKCMPGREAVLADPQLLRDTCGGDSGGPVFLKSDANFFITAVTSREVRGGACGPGGIYTLITPAVVKWMKRLGVNASSE
ncbi:S1 family peptidase [Hyphomicrobium facile]|uniref:Trypsin n=1 Tax=Hyphomicrobium facile TaxID=51670 RepID=A0A1I7NVM4_9HYPH|nr:trypsin-like serine protease [Hyphomicrobium facile]SFV38692.1 Trypsin [Hyphomicrobium facile]